MTRQPGGNRYRMMIIASTKKTHFCWQFKYINSSLKYQDCNNMFLVMRSRMLLWRRFGVKIIFTVCSCFSLSCFATKESRARKPNIHFFCIPAQKVVINDFSTAAVESFLKFLYSGTIDMPVERLVEVSAIADKYQVMEFKKLCLTAMEDT